MSEFTNLQINNTNIGDINTPIELTYERCQDLEKRVYFANGSVLCDKVEMAYIICKLGTYCLGSSPRILEDVKTFITNLTNEKLIELVKEYYNNYVIYDISVFEIKRRINIYKINEIAESKKSKNETEEPKKSKKTQSKKETKKSEKNSEKKEVSEKTSKKKSIPKALRKKVWEKEIGDTLNGICYVCSRSIQFDQFECGHIIAEINNGPTHIDNLKVLCKPCNNSCYTTDLEVFKNSIISKVQLIENEVKNTPSFLPNTLISQPKSNFDIQREMFKLRF